MKIKEIVLEGFKSYGTRTVVEEFDPEFTGVTGLNGSGKSNILDSICFVLGLRSLGLARAGKIQDLIYKGGQAGIKEASVTITFDNSNKSKSPVGFQDAKVIKVTRKITQDKTKYFINGVTVTHTAVTRMFKSIGLNIDRPETFFVQQGKITKIVNFKPNEALEMLLEAAGVAYFREVAGQTKGELDEKTDRLAITEERMNATFGPKLAQLERDKKKLHEFEALKSEIDSLSNLYTRLIKYNTAKNLTQLTKQLQSKQQQAVQLKIHLKELEAEKDSIAQEARSRDSMNPEGGEAAKVLEDKKEKVKVARANFEKETTELKLQEEAFEQKNKQHSKLEKDRSALQSSLTSSSTTHKQLLSQQEVLEQKLQSAEEEINNIQIQSATNSSAAEASAPIQARLDKCKDRLFALDQKDKERTQQLTRWTQETKDRRLEAAQDLKHQQAKAAEIAQLAAELSALTPQLAKPQQLETQTKETDRQLVKLTAEEREAQRLLVERRIRAEDFELSYRNPYSGFDRAQVLGRAFQLVSVGKEFQKAYEAGVSGKLVNIVVTKDEVSMALLKGKCLDTFAVFLPINQLRWPQLPPEFVDEITRVAKEAGGKVWFPDSPDVARHVTDTVAGNQLKALVSYLGAGWVICDSVDLADRLSSNGRYSIRAVTTAGDVFDPSGQISGGYNDPNKGNLLAKWVEYQQIRGNFTADIGILRKKLEDLNREKDGLMQEAENAERLKQRLAKLDGNSGIDRFTMDLKPKAQSAEERLQEIETLIEASKVESENDKREIGKLDKEMKELEAVLKQLKSADQTQVQKTLKARVEAAKSEQQKMMTEKKALMQKECELAAEINRLSSELLKNQEDTKKLTEQLKLATVTNQERKMALQAKKTRLTEQEEELQRDIKEYDELVGMKNLARQKLNLKEKEVNEAKSQLDKVHAEESSLKSEIDKARSMIGEKAPSGATSMLASAESFSQDAELDALDQKKVARDLAQRKEEYLRLEPAVRREAESERGRLAEQMADLFQKKDTVNENKVQIQSNLRQMDFKSEDSLFECFQFVNKNLGKIFNLLLPGAMASMELIQSPGEEGRKKITGVQMKIGFNGQWKQSMTELSGGQRSLLALSFLLAMLQYKPAPFYILDEIDSAMDLSHTENIGYILSNFFPQSQFIVISLKGGLFNQANVLFRTALIDGRSVVTRFEQKKHRQKATMIVSEEGTDQAGEQAASQNRRIVAEDKENVRPQQTAANRILSEAEEAEGSRTAQKQAAGRGRRR